jgi:hypothetical protein
MSDRVPCMWSYATSQTRSGRSGSQLRSFPRFHRLAAPGSRCPLALASSCAAAQSRQGWSSSAPARSGVSSTTSSLRTVAVNAAATPTWWSVWIVIVDDLLDPEHDLVAFGFA